MKIAALAILILASISATLAEQCGRQAEDALCPNNLCCSKWGFCGSTDAYCKEGCQSQCKVEGAAEQCGRQAEDALCPNNLCCSKWGFCGSTDAYCKEGCQSQCKKEGVAAVLGSSEFETMLLHRNDERCPAKGFYTYESFLAAANSFPDFGTTGDIADQKRDIAAFFAHTSHDTDGGWPGAPDGEYAWGYCFFLPEKQGFPSNRKYGVPREVPQNAILSFQKALSVWMAERPPKPSGHTVMNGEWKPTSSQEANGQLPGFGLTINIINGREECGRHEEDNRAQNRIGFYKRFCDILGVTYGDNVDCKDQLPFNVGRSVGNIYMQ